MSVETCDNFHWDGKKMVCKEGIKDMKLLGGCNALMCRDYSPIMMDNRGMERKIHRPWNSNKRRGKK